MFYIVSNYKLLGFVGNFNSSNLQYNYETKHYGLSNKNVFK